MTLRAILFKETSIKIKPSPCTERVLFWELEMSCGQAVIFKQYAIVERSYVGSLIESSIRAHNSLSKASALKVNTALRGDPVVHLKDGYHVILATYSSCLESYTLESTQKIPLVYERYSGQLCVRELLLIRDFPPNAHYPSMVNWICQASKRAKRLL
jgi:hypothetical protein